jgi:hypothetical protein
MSFILTSFRSFCRCVFMSLCLSFLRSYHYVVPSYSIVSPLCVACLFFVSFCMDFLLSLDCVGSCFLNYAGAYVTVQSYLVLVNKYVFYFCSCCRVSCNLWSL